MELPDGYLQLDADLRAARRGTLPYLTDVIEKLAVGWPAHRMAELLPDRWASAHPQASSVAAE
ncbi:MAG: transposase domain-containing protein [Deltaproteobacteria bacterium]|nr:transposase domain-containing protein [Deltaproteobacteria bacterium]